MNPLGGGGFFWLSGDKLSLPFVTQIRRRLKVTVLLWQFRFSSIAFGWLRTAQDFRSSLLEGVGTMLDHAEATLEPVMLPPSTGNSDDEFRVDL